VGGPLAQIAHGQNIWLKATFGGQYFFSLILPQAPLNLPLGFANVLLIPRSERFTAWDVINDPGCTDGNAATGGLDICQNDTDPNDPEEPLFGEPSGVVGIRKFFSNPLFDPTQAPSATNSPFTFGVSCAGCHAGLNPQNPPADPNHPTWANIHLKRRATSTSTPAPSSAPTYRRATRATRSSTPGRRRRGGRASVPRHCADLHRQG
jgi:hypothetical protein